MLVLAACSLEQPVAALRSPSVVELGGMLGCVRCSGGTPGLPPEINGHGCWCGLGPYGSRPEPVDEQDTCCREHDGAYAAAAADGCNCKLQPYGRGPDGWQCKAKNIGQQNMQVDVVCSAKLTGCAAKCCKADEVFAECLFKLDKDHSDTSCVDKKQCPAKKGAKTVPKRRGAPTAMLLGAPAVKPALTAMPCPVGEICPDTDPGGAKLIQRAV